MTSLIRREDADLSAPVPRWRPRVAAEDPLATIDPEILARDERIQLLESHIAALQDEHDAALQRARVEGAKEAVAAFVHDETEALALLETSIAAAAEKLANALAMLEQLALLLCETALNGVFEDTSPSHALVEAAIGLQMRALNRESVIAITVSPNDFSDDGQALASLASKYKGVAVALDSSLLHGTCSIRLRLGSIDIDIPAHWRALQRRLAEMAGVT